MALRLHLGRYLSIGRTGIRLHFNGRRGGVSTGSAGTRGYFRLGPFYWTGGPR